MCIRDRDAITTGRMFHNQWYKRIFAPAPPGAKPMDFTPEYSTLPEGGVTYVADFLPKARILYLIRHPVDRAVSQLRMNLRRARRRFIRSCDTARSTGWRIR